MDFEGVGIDISSAAVKKAKVKANKRNVDCRFHAVNFLDDKALYSVIKKPFDLVMDYGCLHSISKQNRSTYLPSLKYVTHSGSLYLLWVFYPRSGFSYTPSVNPEEVRELFSQDFNILEERPATRGKMFYIMEPISSDSRTLSTTVKSLRKASIN